MPHTTYEMAQQRRLLFRESDDEGKLAMIRGNDVYGATIIGVLVMREASAYNPNFPQVTREKVIIPWSRVFELAAHPQDDILNVGRPEPRDGKLW